MTLTTSKGKTVDANWAWAPANENGDLMIEYADPRKISEIAPDWDGCAIIHRQSDTEGNAVYEGYTDIRIISKMKNGAVQITLRRESNG